MHQMRTQSTSLSNHLTAGYLEKEIVSLFISTEIHMQKHTLSHFPKARKCILEGLIIS
jgi:hypothetical protein